MRALTRTAGKWEESHPEDIAAWMLTHTEADAVVMHEGVYYCALPETQRKNAESGKNTGTFEELFATLPHPDPTEHPNFCADGREVKGWLGWAICGWREVCQGSQLYCKGGDDGKA